MSYWAERMAETQSALTAKGIEEIEKQLQRYYRITRNRVINDFESTYSKVLSAIEEGKEITPADLYKLDKYWQMLGQLKIELQNLGDKQIVELSKRFTKQYLDVYNILNLPSKSFFNSIDKATAEQMINQIWCADGKSWSQRVWNNLDRLQYTLNQNLIDCLVAGRKTSDLKEILQAEFDVAYNRADSLVRTEMAHIQTQSAQQRYKDAGIEMVQVWADKDERRCPKCGAIHKTKYNINEKIPLPLHPRCRCCIIPVID